MIKTAIIIIESIILLIMSLRDIQYRRIDPSVFFIFLLFLSFYLFLFEIPLLITILFCLIFFIFSLISILSKYAYGLGDAIILSVLCLFFKDYIQCINFFGILAGILFAIFIFYSFPKLFDIKREKLFKNSFILPINKIKPGMVLADDKIGIGLTKKDIKELKKKNIKELKVKQPLPFIPFIAFAFFLSFLL